MGLEMLEIVMCVEERFSIEIEDDLVGQMRTVGDLQRVVCSLVQSQDADGPCLNVVLFGRLRHAMVDVVSIPRNRVRLATPLAVLLGEEQLPYWWGQLGAKSGLTLPKLEYASSAGFWFSIIHLGFLIVTAITLGLFLPIGAGWVLSIILTLILCRQSCGILDRYRRYLPSNCQTVRDLVKRCAGLNWRLNHQKRYMFLEKQCNEMVVDCIVEQTGIDRDQIKHDSDFIKDLNCG